jgi:hypothetical protein
MITVIQVITNGEILSVTSKKISIIDNTTEKSKIDHQNDEKGETGQEEVESRNLVSEGLLSLDLLITHTDALLSTITNYNQKIYSFFKTKLNTPPPEGYHFFNREKFIVKILI